MKRALLGAVAVVLVVSSSGAGLKDESAFRPVQGRPRIEKFLDPMEAWLRANHKVLRTQGPVVVVPAGPQPGFAQTPSPWPVPGLDDRFLPNAQSWSSPAPYPGTVFVPDPAAVWVAPRAVDRCLIMVDGSAFDPRFVTKVPTVGSRMIVAPRVMGLPAGSMSYRP